MANLYISGKSAVQIGEVAGVSSQSIYPHLKKMRIIIRSNKEATELAYKQGRCQRQYGQKHHAWKGGHISPNGYKMITIHGKTMAEHKIIWEEHNGLLPNGWIIHHLNGIRTDNRIENLFAMSRKRHSPTLIIEPFRKRILDLEQEILDRKGIKL